MDTETERKILDGLREISAGRTVILIAHRVSTLRHADQIVVLEAGRIVEQGTTKDCWQRAGTTPNWNACKASRAIWTMTTSAPPPPTRPPTCWQRAAKLSPAAHQRNRKVMK